VLASTAGDLELRIPKLRAGSFFPSLLERRRRVDQSLFAVIMEAYLHGTSTRKVARLGYHRYGVHGGDHGAFLAPRIGRDHPEHVLGVHVNALVTFPTGDPADMAALTEADKQRLAAMKQFQDDGSAYMQLAGTRPNTIAQLLADSPAGQLAWITEKYKEWTDQPHQLPDQAVSAVKVNYTARKSSANSLAWSAWLLTSPGLRPGFHRQSRWIAPEGMGPGASRRAGASLPIPSLI
jgi:hypothetical protein